MTESSDTRSDVTHQSILDAASRQFARRPFNLVSLDDVGVRHVHDMDDTVGFLTSVGNSWCRTLPGFANPDRIEYLKQFVERRATAAVRSIEARR